MQDSIAPGERKEHQNQGALVTLSLGDIVAFGRSYFRWLLIGPAVGLVLGMALAMMSTPRYTGEAMVAMEQTPTDIGRFDTSGVFDVSQVETQMTLLGSRLMAQAVAISLGLHEKEAETGGQSLIGSIKSGLGSIKSSLFGIFGGGSGEEISDADAKQARLQQVVETLQKGVEVEREGYSYVLRIRYTSTSRSDASLIANAYAESYVRDKLRRREEIARRGADWLERKLEISRVQMNDAMRAVQQFKVRGDYRLQANQAGASANAANGGDGDATVITLEELESRAETYRKIFEGYLQAYSDALQKQSYPFTNARVISLASGKAKKTHPRTLAYMIAGLMLGGILALGLALINEGLYGTLLRRMNRVPQS